MEVVEGSLDGKESEEAVDSFVSLLMDVLPQPVSVGLLQLLQTSCRERPALLLQVHVVM